MATPHSALPKLADCKLVKGGPLLPFFGGRDCEYEMRKAGLIIVRQLDGWDWMTAKANRCDRFRELDRLIARENRNGRKWAREYCERQVQSLRRQRAA